MSKQRKTQMLLLTVALAAVIFTGCGMMDLIKVEVMISQGKYNEVIPILEKYVAENPDAVEARSRLGFAYLKSGRIDDAIVTLEKTLEIQAGEPYAVLYLGMAYLNKEKYDEAIAVWQKFKDEKRPLVEEEIKRLKTLVQIAESQKVAKAAIANEKKLQTEKF